MLMTSRWPQFREDLRFPEEEQKMELIMDAIRAVRARRAEMGVPPSRKARLILVTGQAETFGQGKDFIRKLAFASDLDITDQAPEDLKGLISAMTHETRIFIPLAELVDIEKELERIEKERRKTEQEISRLEAKLNNPGFTAKAPEAVVAAERDKFDKLRSLLEKLDESAWQMRQ